MSYRKGPLTTGNLLDTAAELEFFADYVEGQFQPTSPERVAQCFLIEVPAHLPELVAEYLRRANGCMAYAGYYYLLMTVGVGQIALASEAAIRLYAQSKGIHTKNFKSNIKILRERQYFTDEQFAEWESLTRIRNLLSHADGPLVFDIALASNYQIRVFNSILEIFPFQTLKIGDTKN